jgi:hypothetical protein
MAALMDEVFFVLLLNIQKQENAKEYSKILFGYMKLNPTCSL